MKAKKWLSLLLVAALALSVVVCLSACTPIDNSDKVTVTWYDNRTELKTEKVKKGSTLTEWTPEKEGYVFTGWFEESSLTNPFKFDTVINEDTNIFSRWRSENVEEDTRFWYAIGSMGESNWKFVTEKNDAEEWTIAEGYESLVFQKTETKNVLELTLTLRPGTKFRFVTNLINSDWTGDGSEAQAGLGNLEGFEFAAGTNPEKGLEVTAESKEYGVVKGSDGKVVFEGGYEFNMPTNTWNIWPVTGSDGVYKFTLTTYPGAEENNTVAWECIEKLQPLTETHDMFLVGTITGNGQDWSGDYETAIKMKRDSNEKTLWKAFITVTEQMYPDWSAAQNPAGVAAAALKVKNNVSGLDYGINDASGTVGANNVFLTAGDYCITYSEKDNAVSFEKLAYYLVGTFVDGEENVNFTVKAGYSTALTSEDGNLYTANLTVTDVSAREGYTWMEAGNICAIKVVYGSSLGIKDDGWYGVGATGNDNYFFTAEGEYVVTLDVAAKTLTVASSTAQKFDVTYYDGETLLDTKSVAEGTSAPNWTPVKEGFDFEGWYTDADLTTEYDFTATITAATSLYAKFVDATPKFDVTYYDGETVLKTETVKEGEAAPNWTPEKQGFTFEGWYTDAALTTEYDFTTATITAATSIYAKFAQAIVLDQRSYFLCGNGTGDIKNSNWAYNAKTAFVRDEGTNIYRLNNFTLKQGDEMKLRFNQGLWNSGNTQYSFKANSFPTEIFTGSDNAIVKAGKSGIYNITLETKGANTATTGANDSQIVRFEFVCVEPLDVTTKDLGCYITGDFLTPPWSTRTGLVGAYKMTETEAGSGIYEITWNLAAGKSLKCIHVESVNGEEKANWANDYTGPNAAGGNYKTAQAGYHKITFNLKAKTFTVEYLGTEKPADPTPAA